MNLCDKAVMAAVLAPPLIGIGYALARANVKKPVPPYKST
jgi:hypothetical protein